MPQFPYFKVLHQSSKSSARVCKISTPHGDIVTPCWVGVGSLGSLKYVDNAILNQISMDLMFVNTYHMLVHPGPSFIEKLGGLHKFIGRTKPIITDSGGFQIYSLMGHKFTEENKELKGNRPHLPKLVISVNEEGVKFRSYRDGRVIHLTPETTIQAQYQMGSDIIIPLDELVPNNISIQKLKKSLEKTLRWEKRSLDEFHSLCNHHDYDEDKNHHNYDNDNKDNPQKLIYGVIHGGTDMELRRYCINQICSMPFDGYAIGGSLGKDRHDLIQLLQQVMIELPKDKPNHLLGIGDPFSILDCIRMGVDTFDSSYITRMSRHGKLFRNFSLTQYLEKGTFCEIFHIQKWFENTYAEDSTSSSNENGGAAMAVSAISSVMMLQKKVDDIMALANEPIDKNCPCHTCKNFTIGFLYHLLKMHDATFFTLATIHNVQFYGDSLKKIQVAILRDEI